MKAGHQPAGPARLSQRPRRPTHRRDVGPAHGLRCHLDHAMPGHRVCVLSEDCPAFTGTPVSSGAEFTVAAGPAAPLVKGAAGCPLMTVSHRQALGLPPASTGGY